MQYAILHYDDEIMTDHATAAALIAEDQAGQPVVRFQVHLLPTTTAMTVRGGKAPVIIDGPYAETDGQLLGIYIVECESLDDAIEAVLHSQKENPGACFEVRPVSEFIEEGTGGAL
jgi:hypothetical protein